MRKIIIIIMFLLLALIIAGCAKPIKEVKTEDNVGKFVTVSGTVTASMKLGALSGYILKDKAGDTIAVSSKNPPEKGKTKFAMGTLRKSILGYYIES